MFKIIAHRTGKSLYGENTLQSAEKSIEIGCHYIEIDLQYTKDNIFVISNTNIINNNIRLDNIEYNHHDEINLPLLSDFIKLILENKHTDILIDIKSIISEIRLLKEINQIEKRVILMSNQLETLVKIKSLNKNIKLAYIAPYFNQEIIDKIYEEVDIIAIGDKSSKPTAELVEYAKTLNLEVWGFTINKLEQMKQLIKIGIAGIITDYPQVLTALCQKGILFHKKDG